VYVYVKERGEGVCVLIMRGCKPAFFVYRFFLPFCNRFLLPRVNKKMPVLKSENRKYPVFYFLPAILTYTCQRCCVRIYVKERGGRVCVGYEG